MEAAIPRSGSGEYTSPIADVSPGTVIASADFNAVKNDLASMQNEARPLSAGGTGATSKTGAQASLGVVPQASTSDATAGSLMMNGAWGLGGAAIAVSGDDCNLITRTGVYIGTASVTSNMPSTGQSYTIFHQQRVTSATTPTAVQWAVRTDGPVYYRVQNFTTTWTSWRLVDGIQSSGSGSNGAYVKYESGAIECRLITSYTAAIATAYLGGFRTAAQTWTFPTAFSTAPTVTVTPVEGSGFSGFLTNATSATQAFYAVTAISSQSSDTRKVNLVAIGG